MAYNDQKIAKVLLEECGSIENRCPGYREAMMELLAEVLNYEREHLISRTNIAQRIGDQVNSVGMFLYRNRNESVD